MSVVDRLLVKLCLCQRLADAEVVLGLQGRLHIFPQWFTRDLFGPRLSAIASSRRPGGARAVACGRKMLRTGAGSGSLSSPATKGRNASDRSAWCS